MAPLDPNAPVSDRPARPARPTAQQHPASPAPASAEEAEFFGGVPPVLNAVPSPAALLGALRKRWLLALFLALAGGAATVALIVSLVPAQYATEVRVQFRRPPDY